MSEFTVSEVLRVSEFIQQYMCANNISSMTADDCANLLSENNILPNKVGPKPGFNFRQMLRDCRDGKITLIEGVFQERPNAKWYIYRVDK